MQIYLGLRKAKEVFFLVIYWKFYGVLGLLVWVSVETHALSLKPRAKGKLLED
jgi:hypothetical protein